MKRGRIQNLSAANKIRKLKFNMAPCIIKTEHGQRENVRKNQKWRRLA